MSIFTDLASIRRQARRQHRCSICGAKAVIGYFKDGKTLPSRCRKHRRKGFVSVPT